MTRTSSFYKNESYKYFYKKKRTLTGVDGFDGFDQQLTVGLDVLDEDQQQFQGRFDDQPIFTGD